MTCAHALQFSNDLKLAHYVKIPPKHTFWAQMMATIVSSLVCTGVLNFQMNQIEGVCTSTQKNHYTCPGINQFFTAAVLWGTIGPKKVFGKGGQYTVLLVGFPIGFVLPFFVYWAQKKFPQQTWLRQVHVVAMIYGGLAWAPYNIGYLWPAVPIGWFSMVYLKKRYLGLWSKVCIDASYQNSLLTICDSITMSSLLPSPRQLHVLQSLSSSLCNGQRLLSIGGEILSASRVVKVHRVWSKSLPMGSTLVRELGNFTEG